MGNKAYQGIKKNPARKPDAPALRVPPKQRPEGFDPFQHGTHQESRHNKHNRPERGAKS